MTSVVIDVRSRRSFLTLAGKAALAIPFLPSLARAQPAPTTPALVCIVSRNGQFTSDFATHTPASALVAVSDPTQPWAEVRSASLASSATGGINDVFDANVVQGYRDHFLHLDGLDHANPLGHGDSQLGFTGYASVDQLAGQALASTPLSSLEIGTPGPSFGRTASFRRSADGRVVQLPGLTQPAALYDRLFGLSSPATRASTQRSLDAVSAEADRLRQRVLSKTDADVLARYMQAVRELSTRIGTLPPLVCAPGSRPIDNVTDLNQLAELQTSLAALAVSCGVKVVSFFVQSAVLSDGRVYDAQWWHNESHATVPSVPTFLDGQRWVARSYFMAMVRKLDALGVWNDSMVVMNSDISSGRLHNNENQPVMLAVGPGVSAFRQRGVYVSYQRASAPVVPQTADRHGLLITQLFNSLLAAQGVAQTLPLPAFVTPERRALYAPVLPGATRPLPWVALP